MSWIYHNNMCRKTACGCTAGTEWTMGAGGRGELWRLEDHSCNWFFQRVRRGRGYEEGHYPVSTSTHTHTHTPPHKLPTHPRNPPQSLIPHRAPLGSARLRLLQKSMKYFPTKMKRNNGWDPCVKVFLIREFTQKGSFASWLAEQRERERVEEEK